MDFPNELKSSVYNTHVPHVSWSAYESNQHDRAQASVTSHDESHNYFQIAALRLRHHGAVVEYDRERRVILLFDIPVDELTVLKPWKGDLEDIVKDCGFEMNASSFVSTGCFDLSYAHSVERLCLDVRWSPSGSLTVCGRWKHFLGLASLSNVFKASNAKDLSNSMIGQQAFLLPFGIQCEFVCLEDRLPDRFGSIDNSKSSATSWLLHHGYHVKPTTRWVCLRYSPQIHPEVPPNAYIENHVWWPAHLCFLIQPAESLTKDTILERIVNGTFTDPIAKAEQWFLGRDARAKLIRAKQQEEEAKARGDNQFSDVTQGNQGIHESAQDPMSWTGQYLTAQEASGIYPTPPDGIISHSQGGSFAAHDTPNNAEHEGYGISASTTGPAIQSSDPGFPDTERDMRPIEEDETQDLFGDMDAEMFGTNDLTEADFNFFDEVPDKDDMIAAPNEALNASPPDLDPDPLVDGGEVVEREKSTAVPATEQPHIDSVDDLKVADTDKDFSTLPKSSQVKAISQNNEDGQPCQQGGTSQSYSDNGKADNVDDTIEGQKMQSSSKQSFFDIVSLKHHPPEFDEKYRLEGRYAAGSPKSMLGQRPSHRSGLSRNELPMIGPLPGDGDSSSSHSESTPEDVEGLIDWDDEEHLTFPPNQRDAYTVDETTTKSSRKRRRETSSGSDEPDVPFHSILESFLDHSQALVPDRLDFQNGQDVEQSLSEMSTSSNAISFEQDQDFVQIAQLVAGQKVLQHGEISPVSTAAGASKDQQSDDATSVDCDFQFLTEVLPGATQCTLKDFLEMVPANVTNSSLNDPAKRRQAALPPHPISPQDNGLFQPKTPFLKVDRGEDAMNIATPALYFWEELGLGPSGHSKDIEAYCLYPSNEAIRNAALAFLAGIENSYQGCKFGRHQRGSVSQKYKEGLVPVTMESVDAEDVSLRYREKCDSLGETLSRFCVQVEAEHIMSGAELPVLEADGMRYVIYVVNPFNDETMLPHLCAAFMQMSTTYTARIEKAGVSNARDLVLQVIPLNFLANRNTVTIPPPNAYRKLAFEVYGRCHPAPGADGTIPGAYTSGSAIHFAKPVPKSINFHLGAQARDNLLFPNPMLHLAYSWNPAQQWLACAWTDNLGDIQWHAVYCLGLPEPDFWAAFLITVKEILDTTLGLMDTQNLHSARLCVVKDSTMYQQELDEPDLQIPLHSATSPTTTTSPNDRSVLTPDHLPSPTMMTTPGRSSTNHLPATTPSASTSTFTDHDPSARLIDIVSETWCFISPIPIQDPYLHNPHRAPVPMSGYILKRRGTEDADGLISLGVNLIDVDVLKSKPRSTTDDVKAQEKVLREMLGMYADLAHLARLRGTEEWREGVLPWHVAAARKAKEAVSKCMRWGERR
ncbi:MAG: hypothetical protein Q9222_002510 [Ikaeria aurantiellina]